MQHPSPIAANDRRLEALLLHREIDEFNGAYAAALDEGRLTDWAEMFTDDAFYVIISRENFDRGMPVGLIYCENKGMICDRAFAHEKTEMFAPRYLRHYVTNVRVLGTAEGLIAAQANYLVLQTLVDEKTTIHQAGGYFDRFTRVAGRLLLHERHCIYDTLIIDNSLVLPV